MTIPALPDVINRGRLMDALHALGLDQDIPVEVDLRHDHIRVVVPVYDANGCRLLIGPRRDDQDFATSSVVIPIQDRPWPGEEAEVEK